MDAIEFRWEMRGSQVEGGKVGAYVEIVAN